VIEAEAPDHTDRVHGEEAVLDAQERLQVSVLSGADIQTGDEA